MKSSWESIAKFCAEVQHCRADASSSASAAASNCGKQWTQIEKTLQVISKISDPAAFLHNAPSAGVRPFPSAVTAGVLCDPVSDLLWLVSRAASSGDPKHPSCAWQAVALLTRLSAASAAVRRDLCRRLRAAAALTDLLLALPQTSHERRLKVLDLLRAATFDARVNRLESFVLSLVPRLVHLATEGKDQAEKYQGVFLLASLTRKSPVVTKFVLSVLGEQERKLFFAREGDDVKIQVLVDFLNLTLCQSSLAASSFASAGSSSEASRLEGRLSRACDAFCAAYSEEDGLLMELCTEFVRGAFDLAAVGSSRTTRKTSQTCSGLGERNRVLAERPEDEKDKTLAIKSESSTTLVSLMKQVLLATDCWEGKVFFASAFKYVPANCHYLILCILFTGDLAGSEATFKFLRTLFSHLEDGSAAADAVIRAVTTRLESSQGAVAAEAARLAQEVVLGLANLKSAPAEKVEEDKENSPQAMVAPAGDAAALLQQLDPVISVLCQLATSSPPQQQQQQDRRRIARTKITALETLAEVCQGGGEWREAVARRVKAKKLGECMRDSEEGDLSSAFVLLAGSMASSEVLGREWRAAFAAVMEGGRTAARLAERLREKDCLERERRHILAVLSEKYQGCSGRNDSGDEDDEIEEEEEAAISLPLPSPTDVDRLRSVESAIEKINLGLERGDLGGTGEGGGGAGSVVSDLLELGDFRMGARRREEEGLRASLRLADERVARQNEALSILEREVSAVYNAISVCPNL